jgi:hypothetical protein
MPLFSSPVRGLQQLLRLWPRIRKANPQAILKVFYGFRYLSGAIAR